MLSTTELSTSNPWPGLRAFTESDKEFFFGRERETAALVSLIQRESVVVLFGQSGLGKTSLIQAGIFPELAKLDFLPLRVRFEFGEDDPPLAEQIMRELFKRLDEARITPPPPDPGETLWAYFHRRDVDFWGPRNRLYTPVIVLDQFEEVFTLGQAGAKVSRRVAEFFAEFESLLEHRPSDAIRADLEAHPEKAGRFDIDRQSIKFVVSMREDFLAYLEPLRDRMPSLLANPFRLERMKGAQALEVVERPGREIVENEVARDIVDFVSSSQRMESTRTLEDRDVDPALLSVVCDELNRRRVELGQHTITSDLLTEEREEIIRKFYERSFEDIDPRIRDWVEDELLTSSGYRKPAALEDALKQGLPSAAFDQLVNRRVLHREKRSGVIWLELTHDLLTDPASRSRTARMTRRQTEEATRREAEIKGKLHRTRMLAGGFAIILIGALAALGYALYMGKKANEAKDLADKAKVLADQKTVEAKDAGDKAIKEADNAKQSLNLAVQTAEGQSATITSWFHDELSHPTPGIFKTIEGSLGLLKGDTTQFPSSTIIQLNNVESLALSSEILANMGLYAQSLENAESALKIIADLEKKSNSAQLQFAKAEATFAKGICHMEAGHINAARGQFNEAVKLAELVQDASFKASAGHVRVSATIGLGDVDIKSFSLEDAKAHFNQALTLTKLYASIAPDDELKAWQFQCHRGLGETQSQTQDTAALAHFQDATRVVEPLMTASPDNLRWQEFDAEVAYLQGITELNLGHIAQASRLLNKSLSMNNTRAMRDPENLKWQVLLAQSYQGMGLLQKSYANISQALVSFKSLKTTASEVMGKQRTWAQASYLVAISMYHLGALNVSDSLDPNTAQDKVLTDRAEALKEFKDSQTAFEALVKSAPENPEFILALVTDMKDQGVMYLQADKFRNVKTALDLYNDGFKRLGQLKNVEGKSWRVQDLRARLHQSLGDLYRVENNFQSSAASYQDAVKVATSSARMLPDPYRDYELLSELENMLGNVLWDPANPTVGTSHYAMAGNDIDIALQRPPHDKDTTLLSQKARVQIEIAISWNSRHDFAQSMKALRAAVDVAREAFTYEPYNYGLVILITEISQLAKEYYNAAVLPARPTDPKPVIPAALLTSANELLDLSNPDTLLLPEAVKRTSNNILVVNKPQNWILPPIMAGAWHTLVPLELAAETKLLAEADLRIRPERVLRIRERQLNFYNNVMLYEAEVNLASGGRGVVSYLRYGQGKTTILDGQPATIYSVNKVAPPILDTVDQATGYLRFFTGAYADDFSGRLVIIDSAEDLNWLSDAAQSQRVSVQGIIRPLMVQENPDHTWGAVGTTQYLSGLFYLMFRVSRDGDVELSKDTSVASNLSIVTEDFSEGTRVLYPKEAQLEKVRSIVKTDPGNTRALSQLPEAYFGLKRYKEAVDAQKSYAAVLKAQEEKVSTNKASRDLLRNAYVSLSWFQLFAKDFKGAEESSDLGLKLDQSFLPTYTNRAHALLFQGKIAEAEAVYKGHLGETETFRGRKWEEAILTDFDDLEAAGITSPEFPRIRKYLQDSLKSSSQ